MPDRELERILDFVNSLGIPAEIGPVGSDAFLPGVRIEAGGLVVRPEDLLTPGDILHEAGHLAVVPGRYRARIGDDVDACVATVLADQPAGALASDPVLANLVDLGGEMQAIAWSYAACQHLRLPLETVFCPGAYGTSPEQSPMALAEQCAWGFFPGIHRLVATGMTTPAPGPLNPTAPAGGFPAMRLWVQP